MDDAVRMTPQTTDAAAREQVLTWLAGRLRFEQLLDRLRAGATETPEASEVRKAA